MNGGKWGSGIPFSNDDLKLYQARELAKEIEECYHDYDVQIKISKKGYNPCAGDGFKFQVKLGGRTRIEKIDSLIPTMRVRLNQPNLRCVSENGVLYFTTFSQSSLSLDNGLERFLRSKEYQFYFQKMKIAHPIGVDEDGIPKVCDLIGYPHALVCGTTMSGKSTALRCLLTTLAQYPSTDVNFLIADKGASLSAFEDLPQCSCPVIHNPNEFTNAILLLEEEMNRRTEMELSDKQNFERLPYIIFVIDEFTWFVNKASRRDETITAINSILDYGRHDKIHLVLSIHDPKSDIMKIEKTNLRVQLAFETVNSRKSSTILGDTGAEKLHGEGEMIFHQGKDMVKLLGFNISDDDAVALAKELSSHIMTYNWPSSDGTVDSYSRQKYSFSISAEDLQRGKTEYTMRVPLAQNVSNVNGNKGDEKERKFADVVIGVLSQISVSINSIQNDYGVGNTYAKDFYNELVSYNILGEVVEKGRRKVLPQSVEGVKRELRKRLFGCGITDEKIVAAIGKRPGTGIETAANQENPEVGQMETSDIEDPGDNLQ